MFVCDTIWGAFVKYGDGMFRIEGANDYNICNKCREDI